MYLKTYQKNPQMVAGAILSGGVLFIMEIDGYWFVNMWCSLRHITKEMILKEFLIG